LSNGPTTAWFGSVPRSSTCRATVSLTNSAGSSPSATASARV
jgi:hypothetical protein